MNTGAMNTGTIDTGTIDTGTIDTGAIGIRAMHSITGTMPIPGQAGRPCT